MQLSTEGKRLIVATLHNTRNRCCWEKEVFSVVCVCSFMALTKATLPNTWGPPTLLLWCFQLPSGQQRALPVVGGPRAMDGLHIKSSVTNWWTSVIDEGHVTHSQAQDKEGRGVREGAPIALYYFWPCPMEYFLMHLCNRLVPDPKVPRSYAVIGLRIVQCNSFLPKKNKPWVIINQE